MEELARLLRKVYPLADKQLHRHLRKAATWLSHRERGILKRELKQAAKRKKK